MSEWKRMHGCFHDTHYTIPGINVAFGKINKRLIISEWESMHTLFVKLTMKLLNNSQFSLKFTGPFNVFWHALKLMVIRELSSKLFR